MTFSDPSADEELNSSPELPKDLLLKDLSRDLSFPDQGSDHENESDHDLLESAPSQDFYSKILHIIPDETLDFEDEEWLNAKISEFKIAKDENYRKGTLSCALCFTPVSYYYLKYFYFLNYRIDIFQYETKYIENCEILTDVIQRDTSDDSVYHPVKCKECDLEIGLQDSDSVVHFFQVFAS